LLLFTLKKLFISYIQTLIYSILFIFSISYSTTNRTLKPWLQPDWLFHLLPVGREHKNTLNVLHGFTNNVIKKRKLKRINTAVIHKEADMVNGINIDVDDDDNDFDSKFSIKKKRLAFLDLLLDANEVKNDLTDTDIREEVDTFMFEVSLIIFIPFLYIFTFLINN